jgi:hypothetical protein
VDALSKGVALHEVGGDVFTSIALLNRGWRTALEALQHERLMAQVHMPIEFRLAMYMPLVLPVAPTLAFGLYRFALKALCQCRGRPKRKVD